MQKAAVELPNAIYEQDFLECSHGFRPRGRQAAGDQNGDWTGAGDFAAAGQHLSSLCARRVVRDGGEAPAEGEVYAIRFADDFIPIAASVNMSAAKRGDLAGREPRQGNLVKSRYR